MNIINWDTLLTSYEGMTIVLTFASIIASTTLSLLVFLLTRKIGHQQNYLVSNSHKIDLFDKRITLFEALYTLRSNVTVSLSILELNKPDYRMLNSIYELYDSWEKKYSPYLSLAGFLFNDTLALNIKDIFIEVRNIHLPTTFKFDDETSEKSIVVAASELHDLIENIDAIFESYDIFEKMTLYLKISGNMTT